MKTKFNQKFKTNTVVPLLARGLRGKNTPGGGLARCMVEKTRSITKSHSYTWMCEFKQNIEKKHKNSRIVFGINLKILSFNKQKHCTPNLIYCLR